MIQQHCGQVLNTLYTVFLHWYNYYILKLTSSCSIKCFSVYDNCVSTHWAVIVNTLHSSPPRRWLTSPLNHGPPREPLYTNYTTSEKIPITRWALQHAHCHTHTHTHHSHHTITHITTHYQYHTLTLSHYHTLTNLYSHFQSMHSLISIPSWRQVMVHIVDLLHIVTLTEVECLLDRAFL